MKPKRYLTKIFILIAAFPLLYTFAAGGSKEQPTLEAGKKIGLDGCVEDADYMRAYHMDLLNEWRDLVVRDGERVYVSTTGEKYEMSLSNTCMKCHVSKVNFCDSCHNYVSVTPYCWDCHVEPRGN